MKKKLLLFFGVTLALITIFAACTPFDADRGEYWNGTRMDALNYSQYVNKELATVMNQLETRMANAELLKTNGLMVEDEIKYTEISLGLIDEAINTVEKVRPPEMYDDDREATLQCMRDARNSVSQYVQYLKSGNTDKLSDYISDMQLRFSALSARFNNWTQ